MVLQSTAIILLRWTRYIVVFAIWPPLASVSANNRCSIDFHFRLFDHSSLMHILLQLHKPCWTVKTVIFLKKGEKAVLTSTTVQNLSCRFYHRLLFLEVSCCLTLSLKLFVERKVIAMRRRYKLSLLSSLNGELV